MPSQNDTKSKSNSSHTDSEYPKLNTSPEVLRHYELLGLENPSFYALYRYTKNRQNDYGDHPFTVRGEEFVLHSLKRYARETGRTTNKIISGIVYARQGKDVTLQSNTNRELSRIRLLAESYLRMISSKEEIYYSQEGRTIEFPTTHGVLRFHQVAHLDHEGRSNLLNEEFMGQEDRYITLVV